MTHNTSQIYVIYWWNLSFFSIHHRGDSPARCDCFHQSECSTVYFNYVQALAQQACELFCDDSRERGFKLKIIPLAIPMNTFWQIKTGVRVNFTRLIYVSHHTVHWCLTTLYIDIHIVTKRWSIYISFDNMFGLLLSNHFMHVTIIHLYGTVYSCTMSWFKLCWCTVNAWAKNSFSRFIDI